MANRELSTTLRNLKFMQRASLKERKPKEDDDEKAKTTDCLGTLPPPARRCIVIMEGDPHPGALKGRMSFDPSVDELNEEAANCQKEAYFSGTEHQNRSFSARFNGPSATGSQDPKVTGLKKDPNVDLKRKQLEMDAQPSTPCTSQTGSNRDGDGDGRSSSQSWRRSSHKQNKRERLDWNVLRPSKLQNRRG